MLPVFVLPARLFSISDVLKKSSSIFDIRLSSVITERVDFSLVSVIGVLESPIAFVILSFMVPKVESASVSNSIIKVLHATASLGLISFFVIKEMYT